MARDPREDIGVNPNPSSGLGAVNSFTTRQQYQAQQQQAAANVKAASSYAGQNLAALYQAGSYGGSSSYGTGATPVGTTSTLGGSGISGILGAASAGLGTSTAGQMTGNPIINQALNAAGVQSGDPMVYVGGTGQYAPQYQSLSSLATQWYTMDQSSKDKFEAQLGLAGYKIESMSDSDLSNLWGAYIGQAAAYTANGKNMTLWDILAQDQKRHQTMKPVTTTSVSRNVQKSTYEDAHALFQTAAQSLLGRAPTTAEAKAFQQALNAKEAANPTITRTTQTTGPGGTTSSSTTSGGFSAQAAQDLAQQQAKNEPGYADYQAATTYFNAFLDAIGHM